MCFLLSKQEVIANDVEIAICGKRSNPTSDSVHVGIYYKYGSHQNVIHFTGNTNPLLKVVNEPISDPKFDDYLFNTVKNFDTMLLSWVHTLAGLLHQSTLNDFTFRRAGIPYNGESFVVNTGQYNTAITTTVPINCGVFAVAFLKSCRYTLIDWSSWTQYTMTGTELSDWLNLYGIPSADWPAHHNYINKNIRGKHILTAPCTTPIPASELNINRIVNSVLASF